MLDKILNVIYSCETQEQLLSAARYLNLASPYLDDSDLEVFSKLLVKRSCYMEYKQSA